VLRSFISQSASLTVMVGAEETVVFAGAAVCDALPFALSPVAIFPLVEDPPHELSEKMVITVRPDKIDFIWVDLEIGFN